MRIRSTVAAVVLIAMAATSAGAIRERHLDRLVGKRVAVIMNTARPDEMVSARIHGRLTVRESHGRLVYGISRPGRVVSPRFIDGYVFFVAEAVSSIRKPGPGHVHIITLERMVTAPHRGEIGRKP